MKITDSETIKNSEKELIDAITGELDWSAIEKLLREKHNIGLQDDVEFRNGDLTVFDSQIAYKLDFDVKITLSVIFDRKGNCLRLSAAGEEDENQSVNTEKNSEPEKTGTENITRQDQPHVSENTEHGTFQDSNDENVKTIASEIAGMISEINNS